MLLILYIIATILCLRSIKKKKGFYKVGKERKQNLATNGRFYEYDEMPVSSEGQMTTLSNTGSRDTEQESLMVMF